MSVCELLADLPFSTKDVSACTSIDTRARELLKSVRKLSISCYSFVAWQQMLMKVHAWTIIWVRVTKSPKPPNVKGNDMSVVIEGGKGVL